MSVKTFACFLMWRWYYPWPIVVSATLKISAPTAKKTSGALWILLESQGLKSSWFFNAQERRDSFILRFSLSGRVWLQIGG